jgi:hypothetical protein
LNGLIGRGVVVMRQRGFLPSLDFHGALIG